MREFGFGANRVLRPYQNPEAKPFFRNFRPSEEERNSLGYNDYAREQDNLVFQEDLINQQLEDQQAQRQQAQRKVARLEQIEDVEDQANEAIAQGVPMDQVIQQFPALAQSSSFGNYMQQVKAIAPAQQTLAPSFRKLLKTPEERADFDQAFQKFGNVNQADDHVRARAQEREHRVSLIDAGVPLAEIEKAGPLTPERAALLKQQYKRSVTGGDPRADKVFDTMNKMLAEGAEDAEIDAYLARMKKYGIDLNPPVKVEPVAAPVAGAVPAQTAEVAEEIPTPEQVRQAKNAHMESPEADENFFVPFIADPNTPLGHKKAALDKFKEYVKTASPPANLTLRQVLSRRKDLDKAVEKAEQEVQLAPELEKYGAKWTEAKNSVDELVNKTATRLGVPKQALVNSLVDGELVRQPDGRDISIPELIDQTWVDENASGEKGKGFKVSVWDREHPALASFKNSKFADELGTRVLGFIPKGKTFGDVLDAYMEEQKAPRGRVASQAPATQAPATQAPKIVIGKPRKIP